MAVGDVGLIWQEMEMDTDKLQEADRLVSRLDLGLWAGLPERHPLVGLFHRFGGIRRLNSAYNQWAHLESSAFIDEVFGQLDVRLEVAEEELNRIPKEGPFVLVANHPFGVLDALALVRLVRRVRPDFKLGVESLLGNTPALAAAFCVVSESRQGGQSVSSAAGWAEASAHVASGGGFGVFPAGGVSGFKMSSRGIADGRWSDAVVGWIEKQEVPVVPVYIDGANSTLFQLLGLIHPSLRSLRVAAEIRNKKGRVLRMRVGRALRKRDLAGFTGTAQLARFLRAKSYALGAAYDVRKEYFRGMRIPKRPEEIAPMADPGVLAQEVADLQDEQLFQHGDFEVYLAPADRIPELLQEIGRCREVTFRAVGEGTNRARDLDEHDLYYQHLLLWDAAHQRLAGAYRVGEGWVIMERYGRRGFYTRSLFRMQKGISSRFAVSVRAWALVHCARLPAQAMPLFCCGRAFWRCCSSPTSRRAMSLGP